MFVVDNVFSGFNLHKLDDGTCIRHFPTATPDAYVIRQVSLTEASKVVVGGSDHGAVYVFDRETGVVLDLLQHAHDGFVQTVTVSMSGIYESCSRLDFDSVTSTME